MQQKKWAAVMAASMLALVGCGGGSGTNDVVSSEGFWSAEDFGLLITRDGEMWAIETDTSTFVLYRGSVSGSGSQVSGQFTGYQGASSFAGSVTGQVTARSRIVGSATALGSTSSFTLTYDTSYDGTPNLANIAGSYSVSSGGTVTIRASGAFTGVDDGCALSGTLTPDSSGKNFYRVTMNFGGSPCLSPYGSATGVLAQSGTGTLAGGVISGGRGDAFVLTRSGS